MIAILCSLLANVNSNGRRYEPSDFMPTWSGKEPQSAEQMIAQFEGVIARADKP